jgi:hypothetical protein
VDTFEDGCSAHPPDLVPVRPYLFVVLECDRPTAGGARYALTGIDEVLIGRGIERSIVRQRVNGVGRLELRVPGRSMSSTHARLSCVSSKWVIEDLGSTNGSTVNGRRVHRASLSEGDVVELGHSVFVLESAVSTPPGTTPDFDFCSAPSTELGLGTMLPALAAQFATLARVAQSGIPVLLLGETGTGKELIARAIHRMSQRSGSFVAINCGAIPGSLLESQLFGHTRGAFTGATRDEVGVIRAAAGGTLLLDEIGDLPASAQPALLRVLQEREVVAVGNPRPIPVDLRIVAATHQLIDGLVHKGRFRQDLLARVDHYRLELPSLRRRRMDIGCIIAALLDREGQTCRFAPQAGVEMVQLGWPCNIRELAAAVRRAMILAEGQIIGLRHLNLARAANPPDISATVAAQEPHQPLDKSFKEDLIARLKESNGNIARVARDMGKARMQVHRWMKRYGIEVSSFRADPMKGET